MEAKQESLTRKIKDQLGTLIGKIDSRIILLEDLYYKPGGGRLYNYPYIYYKINNVVLENSLIKKKLPKEDFKVTKKYSIAKFPEHPNSVELLCVISITIILSIAFTTLC